MVALSTLNKEAAAMCSTLETLLGKTIVRIINKPKEEKQIIADHEKKETKVNLVLINLCKPENV